MFRRRSASYGCLDGKAPSSSGVGSNGKQLPRAFYATKKKKNVKAHYYAILTYMDGKTMHPNSGGAPFTASRRTTERTGRAPVLAKQTFAKKKKQHALSNSPAFSLPRFFSGDDDVAFFDVMYTQSVSFHSPSLALLTRNICKNIFIIYKTLSITLFLSTYPLCWVACV